MSADVLILAISGGCAILGGSLIVLLSPRRLTTLLAGLALGLLGLQQLGLAKAIHAISWTKEDYWFDLSLVWALPVSLAWLLLSMTLARGRSTISRRGWRLYVVGQALASLAAVVLIQKVPALGQSALEQGGSAPRLRSFGLWISGSLFVNLTLLTANFEATYLALSAAGRRHFRPGLYGILLCAGIFGYMIVSAMLLRRLPIWQLAVGSIPVAGLSFLLVLSLVRHRAAEDMIVETVRPPHKTASVVLAGILSAILVLFEIVSRLTGYTLSRTAWILSLCGVVLALTVMVISNRAQRLVLHALDPYLYRLRFDEETIAVKLATHLDSARTPEELFGLIPSSAAAVAGVKPVTLFARRGPDGAYDAVGSTIEPKPVATVAPEEPLARELLRQGRSVRLRGRTDDLEYIPIYVENARQIQACEANCAVPLVWGGRLLGFLMCGLPRMGRENVLETISLLEIIARQCAARMALLLDRGALRAT